jgi:GTP cyclohydrolase II
MNFDPDLLAAERAVDEVRCGRPIVVASGPTLALYAAAETIAQSAMDRMREIVGGSWSLLVTSKRASALGLDQTSSAGAQRLHLDARAKLAGIATLASSPGAPSFNNRMPRGSALHGCAADETDKAVIDLLKSAWLLPAALRMAVDRSRSARVIDLVADRVLHQVAASALATLAKDIENRVVMISEASIPLTDAPEARLLCFRSAVGSREHLAMVIGDPLDKAAVPVRVHSACLTGDVFGSLRCDCGEQLRQSVAALWNLGGGVLLYLAQEGRGIGLANKLRAYTLQEGGHDTIDADMQLGFEPDERRYAVAAAILRSMGCRRIRLMTNNPEKIEELAQAGISIVERLPLLAPVTRQNRRYMDAKRVRARHLLDPAGGAG